MIPNTWKHVLELIETQGYVRLEPYWYFMHDDRLVQWRDEDRMGMYIELDEAKTTFLNYQYFPRPHEKLIAVRLEQFRMMELL